MRSIQALSIPALLALAACGALLGVDDLEVVDPDGGPDGGPPLTDIDGAPITPPDARADAPATPCTSTCTTEGAARCAGIEVERCEKRGACLEWSKQACAGDSICCAGDAGGACIPVSAANCYACGTSCTATTPACLPGPKRCGCTPAVCATQNQGCDATTGNCVACTTPPPGVTELFVDATSAASGTGTAVCPFRTITAALASAALRQAVTTIRVAAGTYSAATGETFPLRVRGVTVEGAGAGVTIVRGDGSYDHSRDGGQFPQTVQIGVLFGAHDKRSALRNLTIRPGTPAVLAGETHHGVMCDRGSYNTPGYPTTLPVPNSLVDNVTFDPGFQVAMSVTTSSTSLADLAYESGCNVKVVGSTFIGGPIGIAVWALGAGRNDSNGQKEYYSGLVFGEDGQAKNSVSGFVNSQNSFGLIGVLGWDNVRSLTVANSVFQNNDIGLLVTQHAASDSTATFNHYEVRTSTFTQQIRRGVIADGSSIVAKLEDNVFTGTRSPAGDGAAVVLATTGSTNTPFSVPVVVRARRNKFIGNDIGVLYVYQRSGTEILASRAQDWGTAADPGANVFRCNSSTVPGGRGGDIRMGTRTTGELSFIGNSWDRVPPTLNSSATPDTAPNGTDFAFRPLSTVPVVLNGALAADACPPGGVP